jgi:hypothetical protein
MAVPGSWRQVGNDGIDIDDVENAFPPLDNVDAVAVNVYLAGVPSIVGRPDSRMSELVFARDVRWMAIGEGDAAIECAV